MNYLMVKDYARHQHYKKRNPVWIKLYNAVQDDEAFVVLSDAARSHLMLIWLLASRRDNKLPHDARLIGRAIQSTSRVDLEGLIAAGFLLPYEPASGLLAQDDGPASELIAGAVPSASLPARPRARVEGETEKERERETDSSSSPDVARLLDGLPAGTVRLSWRSEIDVASQGMHGAILTAEQVDRACRDYVGNGHLASPSLRHFRAFLADAGRGPRPTNGVATPPDDAESAWESVLAMVPAWQRREITASVHLALPEGVKRGISKIGGFKVLSETRTENLTWLKKDFLAAYRNAPKTLATA